jgi:putative proteasome-type protease
MDSTLNSNISVGLPLDLLVYEKNSLQPSKLVTLDESNPYFQMIHQLWGEKLRSAFNSIAEPSWSGAHKSSAISAPAKRMVPVPIHHQPPQPRALKKAVAKKSSDKELPAKKVSAKKKA